jgi:hypothetical protein
MDYPSPSPRMKVALLCWLFLLPGLILLYGCGPGEGPAGSRGVPAAPLVEGAPFPSFARFHGWVGSQWRVLPRFQGSPSPELHYLIHFEDVALNRQRRPDRRNLVQAGHLSDGQPLEQMIVVKRIRKDGRHGTAFRFHVNGYWQGASNHRIEGTPVFFHPFPRDANSPVLQFDLTPFPRQELAWDQPLRVFSLTLHRRTEEGDQPWGHRHYYLTLSPEAIPLEETR